MKGKKRFQWCSIILLVFCLTACQVKRPKTVLSDAKMENVLYDFHIAKALGEDIPYGESYKRVLYIESVYKKHGITQADFDTSMVWYARHPDVLTKVYEKVNQRLKSQRDGINHLIALRDNKPKESLPGDSIDVWIWQHVYELTGMPLDNKIAFILPVDTNFKDRDTLKWTVRFRFNNGKPDSVLAPLMAMQILYDKDTINDLLKIKEPITETLTLTADTFGKIKEVRGFIYYPMQKTVQSLLVDQISLMRYHATDTLFNVKKDSIAVENAKKDTLAEKSVKPLEIKSVEEKNIRRNELRLRPQLRKNTSK
ncbi:MULTISPECIES: DUF4296 domain-containing protein [Bacteroides]|jgi:hypothetical protein|uniref:DUF4296 domain-containing protein n=1 Tax=Bacteroides TaxID=816 RepID=UPI000C770137|nr:MULTISPECIES: DUF4296 domain-containing protein [Bacteroides]RGM46847.1 DUF4296 domain-containing protein [Bacteroides sp. OM08-11]